MGLFDLGTNVVEEEETDNLGGGGPVDSGLYDYVIKMAYLSKAKSGAMAVNLELLSTTGQTLRKTDYISSGDAKGNSFTYVDKKTNEVKPLPGYSKLNTLCLLAAGVKLKEIDPDKKVINVWNYDLKRDVPTEVPVLMELLDQDITVGVLKVLEAKQVKNDQGIYVDEYDQGVLQTRELNEMDKFFRTRDQLTVAEILAEAEVADFANRWVAKNTGNTKDKTKGKGKAPAASTGASSASASTSEAPAPKKSLFG